MTPELELMRKKWKSLGAIVRDLEMSLVDDPDWPEPSTIRYLSVKQRANPDIMSNVEAMAATNKLIMWFGRYRGGFLGYWLGPKGTPPAKTHVICLDSEGQYRRAGPTIANFIAVSVDEDRFASTRKTLVGAGFKVLASQNSIWKSLDELESPNTYRHVLYNEARKRRGLKPIK